MNLQSFDSHLRDLLGKNANLLGNNNLMMIICLIIYFIFQYIECQKIKLELSETEIKFGKKFNWK